MESTSLSSEGVDLKTRNSIHSENQIHLWAEVGTTISSHLQTSWWLPELSCQFSYQVWWSLFHHLWFQKKYQRRNSTNYFLHPNDLKGHYPTPHRLQAIWWRKVRRISRTRPTIAWSRCEPSLCFGFTVFGAWDPSWISGWGVRFLFWLMLRNWLWENLEGGF